jgi:hypothetical protein
MIDKTVETSVDSSPRQRPPSLLRYAREKNLLPTPAQEVSKKPNLHPFLPKVRKIFAGSHHSDLLPPELRNLATKASEPPVTTSPQQPLTSLEVEKTRLNRPTIHRSATHARTTAELAQVVFAPLEKLLDTIRTEPIDIEHEVESHRRPTEINKRFFEQRLSELTEDFKKALENLREAKARRLLTAIEKFNLSIQADFEVLKELVLDERHQIKANIKEIIKNNGAQIDQLIYRLINRTYILLVMYQLVQEKGTPSTSAQSFLKLLGRSLTLFTLEKVGTFSNLRKLAFLTYLFDVWNQSVAHPQPKGLNREAVIKGDEKLTKGGGAFGLEFENAKDMQLTAYVFLDLRLKAESMWGRDGALPSSFVDGQTHSALPRREYYYFTLKYGDKVVKFEIPAKLLAVDPSGQKRFSQEEIDAAYLEFYPYFLNKLKEIKQNNGIHTQGTLSPEQLAEAKRKNHIQGVTYQQRESRVSNTADLEVADLKTIIHPFREKGPFTSTSPLTMATNPENYVTATPQAVQFLLTQTGELASRYGVQSNHTWIDGAQAEKKEYILYEQMQAMMDRLGLAKYNQINQQTKQTFEEVFGPIVESPIQNDGSYQMVQSIIHRPKYQTRIDTLYSANKDTLFPISFPMIMSLAVAMTLKVESVHFLEKITDQNGLSPSILQFSRYIQEAIQQTQNGRPLDPEIAQLWLLELGMWQKISRKNTQLGMGETSILSAVAGNRLRPVLSMGAQITDRETNAKLTNTVLISSLLGAKAISPEPGKMYATRFSTAEAEIYPEKGVAAISGENGNAVIIMKDTGQDQELQVRFARELETNFELILGSLEQACATAKSF